MTIIGRKRAHDSDHGSDSPNDAVLSKSPAQGTVVAQEEDLVIQKTPQKTWRSYIWDTLDKSPEERRFLFKLDAIILTFASLGYFSKNLNQININNAFASGMKEDLGMYGNQLNYMQTCWTVGYVLGEIPRQVRFLYSPNYN